MKMQAIHEADFGIVDTPHAEQSIRHNVKEEILSEISLWDKARA